MRYVFRSSGRRPRGRRSLRRPAPGRPVPLPASLLAGLLAVLSAGACGGGPGAAGAGEAAAREAAAGGGGDTGAAADAEVLRLFRVSLENATALADSVEDLLRPVPLMRSGDIEELRRFPNAVHVRTARRLGVRPDDESALDSLVDAGVLVALEDTAEFWVLRDMSASRPLVTPDTRRLLESLGAAFQDRLAGMGLPRFRFEISSALRTPAAQAALRARNPNATAGTSAHEFGTTVDIPYSGYAAPAALSDELVAEGPARAERDAVVRAILERMAARKSRELQAILGDVMREAQSAGDVLVTFERLQPVYHITVARPQ